MSSIQKTSQEEWVNILTKGMITIPKKMRDKLGIKDGDIAKVKIDGKTLIVEPKSQVTFEDVRMFSKKQIEDWIREDSLPEKLEKEVAQYWKDLP